MSDDGEVQGLVELGIKPPMICHRGPLGEDGEKQDLIPGTLHGNRNARGVGRKYGQYWHKSAIILFAQGMSCKQVSDAIGIGYDSIKTVNAESWFQEEVTKVIVDNGGKDIIESFKRAAGSAAALIISTIDNEKAPLKDRLNSANNVIERIYGKATQNLKVETVKCDDPVAEVERLKRENEQLVAAQVPGLS